MSFGPKQNINSDIQNITPIKTSNEIPFLYCNNFRLNFQFSGSSAIVNFKISTEIKNTFKKCYRIELGCRKTWFNSNICLERYRI